MEILDYTSNQKENSPRKVEINVKKQNNIFSIILIGFILVVSFFVIYFSFMLEPINAALISLIFLVVYGISLFFLLQPVVVREVTKTEIKTVETPVTKEVIIEKPVYRDIVKNVYVEKKSKKLNIPKYEFVGSSETKRFHTRNCRLGKLIKKKFKVSNNSKAFFVKNKFKACKVCIRKTKKI